MICYDLHMSESERATPERQELFDRWAESYDRTVPETDEFPFAGYLQVLRELHSSAKVDAGAAVLDLGTGTGALAELFFAEGCSVWATDFSPKMVERARSKLPEVRFELADLRDSPPASFPRRYDRVVSAYALHHLVLEEKLSLMSRLTREHLLPGGRVLIADVSFPTAREREAARSQYEARWDASESYWAADEVQRALEREPVTLHYTQVSFCAGIFSLEAKLG